MTLNRKSAVAVAATFVAGALFAPALASADGHGHGNGGGKGREPIAVPPWDTPFPEDKDSGHSPTLHLPESHKSDILDIPDHQILPDLHKLPDFKDFHHHYKKEGKSEPVLVEKDYPPEPIAYPPLAQTDSLAPAGSDGEDILPLSLAAVAILGAAGVAVRRANPR